MRQDRLTIQWITAMICCLAVFVHAATAQKIAQASSGQITSVTQSVRAGAIARGPGGERVGTGDFAVNERTPGVVRGKVAGYGVRAVTGLGEYVSQGQGVGFASNFRGVNFTGGDFVGTMPGPASIATNSAASGFGITLSAGNTAGSRSAFSSPRPHAIKTTPQKTMKDPEAILHPFTHTIGIGKSAGTLLGSPSGIGH